jgi:hypothetical protein
LPKRSINIFWPSEQFFVLYALNPVKIEYWRKNYWKEKGCKITLI